MSDMPKELGRTDRYLWALGLFVDRFSGVEVRLQITLRQLAGVSRLIAPAVFTQGLEPKLR
jgi:hypothetical protein